MVHTYRVYAGLIAPLKGANMGGLFKQIMALIFYPDKSSVTVK